MSADDALERAAETMRALAHPVRLALLTALVDGEQSVGQMEGRTGLRQPALSQQLGILRNAGLVATRREAKQVFYRVEPARIAHVGDMLDRFAGRSPVANRAAPDPQPRSSGTAAAFARVG